MYAQELVSAVPQQWHCTLLCFVPEVRGQGCNSISLLELNAGQQQHSSTMHKAL
jgi:hypothetical protein